MSDWTDGLGEELFEAAGREQGLPDVIEDPATIERFVALVLR
jgi:hypothetical protein